MVWAFRILLVASVLAIGSPPALAASQTVRVKLWNAQAALPIPEGFCLLSEAEPMDREVLDNTRKFNEGLNEVLAVFADCGELRALRSRSRTLTNFGSYLLGLSGGPKPLTIARAKFTASVADYLRANDPYATAAQDIKDRAARIGVLLEQETMVSLGLIHSDETAVYTGVIMPDLAEGAGPGDRGIVVTGITLLKGYPVSLNLNTDYRDASAIPPLLATQRKNLQNLVKAN